MSSRIIVACLQKLSTYCENEEMYFKTMLEDMKAQKASITIHDDKQLLSLFENKLVDILRINRAY